MMKHATKISVVIPCYRVGRGVLSVIPFIGPEVQRIYVVDDACPEETGKIVDRECKDTRVHVLYHEKNQGVGGAVITGYRAAIADGADILVKLDGDGQMDPRLIPNLIKSIQLGKADYTKGNRFYHWREGARMPFIRRLGNLGLSFLTKLSSGYFRVFDPTNGFTALHARVAELLPFAQIQRRYFFESDMLFRLNIVRAVVQDIPMRPVYAEEKSNLSIFRVLVTFPLLHIRNVLKRVFYRYFLHDFNMGSIHLLLGLILTVFGMFYGMNAWQESEVTGVPATSGTVMLAAMPIIVGMQFLLSFLNVDMESEPIQPVGGLLADIPEEKAEP